MLFRGSFSLESRRGLEITGKGMLATVDAIAERLPLKVGGLFANLAEKAYSLIFT